MRFQELRKSVGLTQTEVAEKLGVSRTAISMWETNEARPRADMLPKIAELYKCTVDELLGKEIPAS